MWTWLIWGWTLAWGAEPLDEAMNALAEGRANTAIQVLQRTLSEDPDHTYRCLLGEVALRSDRPALSLSILQEVPEEASCALRAASTQAEAWVALGRLDEAAARYAEVGEELLGPERHQPIADRLVAWADRLQGQNDQDAAVAVLSLTSNLQIAAPQRLAYARRLAKLGGQGAIEPLSIAIAQAPDHAAADRHLLSDLLPPERALALLAPLPDSPETDAARTRAALRLDLATGVLRATELWQAHPNHPEARALALDAGRRAAQRLWTVEADALLSPLATAEDETGAAASWALARLAATTGDPGAQAQISEVLRRFPRADFRSEAQATLQALRRSEARGRAAQGGEASDPYGELLAAHPEDEALALEAAWTLDGDARLARLEEVAARWPHSPAALEAIRGRVQLDPDGGWAWLQAQAEAGRSRAPQIFAELGTPHLAIENPGRQPHQPVVQLQVRNVTEVEMRLHRIDLEGFVRAGRGPDDLDGLDVGIIAPDHTWKVQLPDSGVGRHASYPVEIPARQPGLYVITAATPEAEASTPLLVSDVELVARRIGKTLVATAFRDGEPARDARLLATGAESVEAKADGAGLLRAQIDEGPQVVLVQTRGGPAMLTLGASPTQAGSSVRVAIDLDRPIYRPGDTVRFRAVGSSGGEPLTGRWRLQLEGSGVHQVLRLQTDRHGAVTGELVLPWFNPGLSESGARIRHFTLVGTPPGQDAPVHLANLPVAMDSPRTHQLRGERDGEHIRFTLTDGQGVPVPEATIQLHTPQGERLVKTDAAGQVTLPAPPAGLAAQVRANLAGTDLMAEAPDPDPLGSLTWTAGPRRWLPGHRGTLHIEGPPGAITIKIMRIEPEVIPPEAPHGPQLVEPAPVQIGTRDAQITGPSPARTVAVEPLILQDGPTPLTLPALEPGTYEILAIAADGRAVSASTQVEVTDGLTLQLGGTPLVGGRASLEVHGGPALVTIERGQLLHAMILRRGQTRLTPVDPTWHGEVSLVATTPSDQHVQHLALDAHLQVDLSARAEAGRWILEGRVTDAAGQPVAAEVLLRGLDQRLLQEIGEPRTLSLWPFLLPEGVSAIDATARDLRSAALAQPISAALRQESERLLQRRKAERAAQLQLEDLRAQSMLYEYAPQTSDDSDGAGYGGVGSGQGHFGGGGLHARSGPSVATRGTSQLRLSGYRESALWQVVQTDRDGKVRVEVPAPHHRSDWRVEAIALSGAAMGRAEATLKPPSQAYFVVDTVAPGWPGDEARPRARILAPEGGATGVFEVDGEQVPYQIGGGEALAVALPPTAPGQSRSLVLLEGDEAIQRQTWTFPIARGEVDPEGEIFVSLSGTDDRSALEIMALEADPQVYTSVARAAIAGRSALAALPHLDPPAKQRAERVVRAALGAVREVPANNATEAAQALLLFAEATDLLALPRSESEAQVARLSTVEPRSPEERLMLAWAFAQATGEAEQATLGRLVRDAGLLSAEDRALLVRLLHHAGEPMDPSWVQGDGPQAILAARLSRIPSIDAVALRASAPPPLGHPDRPDWLRAAAPWLASSRGGTGIVRSADPGSEGVFSWREGIFRGAEVAAPTLSRLAAEPNGQPREILDPPTCGAPDSPCRVVLGEALISPQLRLVASGGLAATGNPRLLHAQTPGRYRLAGSLRGDQALDPLHVEVVEEGPLTELGEGAIQRAATLTLARGEDAGPLLASRPSLEDWSSPHRAGAARLRFVALDRRAAAGEPPDPALHVAAFEDLRDEAPSTPIELDAVARTAHAYLAAGRADRALGLWRRTLGQAFLSEAQIAGRLEHQAGELAALTVLREATQRFPAVPLVQQAAFALPDRLLDLADRLPAEVRSQGLTPTDIRLMAASWDRAFLGLHPDSPHAPEAGLRLATGLLTLGARAQALEWVRRLIDRHPEHALLDQWLLLAAQIATEEGESQAAQRALFRVAQEELPQGGGQLGPSPLREDARFALGRLAEAHDRPEEAQEWYQQVSHTIPDAALALSALKAVDLKTDPFVAIEGNAPARLAVLATNLDTVHVSAFAINLRTLFLRDGGLPRAQDLRVEGLAPVWTGTRQLRAGSFPSERTFTVPLSGPGAWLIRVDGDRASTSTLLIRSNLKLHHTDGDQRRLALRAGSRPAREAGIRALSGAEIIAAETDVRGVALVPMGAPALAWQGNHYAFTEDAWVDAPRVYSPPAQSKPKGHDILKARQESREQQRRMQNRMDFDYIGQEGGGSIDASELF